MVPEPVLPNYRMLPTFLRSLVSRRGIALILVLTFVLVFTRFILCVGSLLGIGVYAGYWFLVLRTTMYGETRLPWVRFDNNVLQDVLLPMVRFLLPSVLLLVPLGLLLNARVGLEVIEDPGVVLTDPVLLVAGLGALVVFPALLIVAAVSDSIAAVVNPANVLALVRRAPRAYAITWLMWVGIEAIDVTLTSVLPVWGTPLAPFPVLGTLVTVCLGLLTAMLFGWMIYANAGAYGLSVAPRRRPLVPGVVPRGRPLQPEAPATRYPDRDPFNKG